MQLHAPVISVSDLNRRVRLAIEKFLPSCWISGEISNSTRASSGHWYFTLKDPHSTVKCVFFRNRNQFLDWVPSEGDQVEVRAQPTLYEPRGDFQLAIDAMRKSGLGALYENFLKLKAKLEAEGLFDKAEKKPPPKYPKRLGVVTSLEGAALQDVLKTLLTRWPQCPIVIYPTNVQGSDAPIQLTNAIDVACRRNECDVILLTRGGGSLEDLQAFNDERLARRIASSNIPIIAAIGHETDASIAEFVASVRTATPTAAAQYAVPDKEEIRQGVVSSQHRLQRSVARLVQFQMQKVDSVTRRVIHPGNEIASKIRYLDQITRRLTRSNHYIFQQHRQKLAYLVGRLDGSAPDCKLKLNQVRNLHKNLKISLNSKLEKMRNRVELRLMSVQQNNPEWALERGFCIAKTDDGRLLHGIGDISPGSTLMLQMKDGEIRTRVEATLYKRDLPFKN